MTPAPSNSASLTTSPLESLAGMSCSFSFLSVCSGIEAASVAWEPLGWKACAFAEIEKFPSAVLAHHWPETPNLGDMTKHHAWPNTLRPDLIVGGTPCQAFSVAGLRQWLADPRGNLTLIFLGILEQFRPRWVVWENVPGVHSATSYNSPDPCPPPPPVDMECDGAEMDTEDEFSAEELHAFNCFLAGLSELGYGIAYRVLDAQHFGVPQRRRRVFVVAYLGDWRRAAAVLFEPACLRGDHPPRREAGQISPTIPARSLGGGGLGTDFDCDGGLIAHSLRGEGFDASEDGTGRGTPLVPCHMTGAGFWKEGFGTLRAREQDSHENLVAFAENSRSEVRLEGGDGSRVGTLSTGGGKPGQGTPCVAYRTSGNCGAWETGDKTDALTTATDPFNHVLRTTAAVRRLTPREYERLQGFPDDHTLIPWRGKMAPDGPRYKALGNSMAVPVMRWIGESISQMNAGALPPVTSERNDDD